jgi:Tfp pilus assembly protein PilV
MSRPVHHNRCRLGRFSLLELMVAALVLTLAVGPVLTMILDCHLRITDAARRRTALATADALLSWAVAKTGVTSPGSPPAAPSGFSSSLTFTPSVGEPKLDIVAASVSWRGRSGNQTLTLTTLRMKP